MINLNSFKAYDVRGRIPDEINEALAYDIGRASAMAVVVVIATILIATLALRMISSLFSDEGMRGR